MFKRDYKIETIQSRQIISYNLKGLQSSKTKGNKLFHYFKLKRINMTLIQGNHSKLEYGNV